MAIFNSYVSLPNGTPQSSNLDWDFHEINHQAIGVSPFMEALIYSQLQTVPQSHSPTVPQSNIFLIQTYALQDGLIDPFLWDVAALLQY